MKALRMILASVAMLVVSACGSNAPEASSSTKTRRGPSCDIYPNMCISKCERVVEMCFPNTNFHKDPCADADFSC